MTLARPRYQYWLLPFAVGVAIALIVALWLFPRIDVLAAASPTDALEARYLALQGDEQLLRTEASRLAALFAAQRRDCARPEPPPVRRDQEARRPPEQPRDQTAPRPPVQRDRPPRPKPSEELKIPEDARRRGDMSFMEGCWNNVTGLFNLKTKEPVVIEYCFGKDGEGEAIITEQNGRQCVAPAKASFDGQGKLQLEDLDDLRCPDGTNYNRNRVQCEAGTDGQASCEGISKDNHRWRANVRRGGGDSARLPQSDPDSGNLPPDDLPMDSDAPPMDDPPPDDTPPDDGTTLDPPPQDDPPPPPIRGERTRPRR